MVPAPQRLEEYIGRLNEMLRPISSSNGIAPFAPPSTPQHPQFFYITKPSRN